MALRFCRAGVDTPYVLLSTPLKRKLLLSERTYVPRPCEGSKTLQQHRDMYGHPGVSSLGRFRRNTDWYAEQGRRARHRALFLKE